ncbi:MAG: ATP-binding protein [Thermoleophilia bacterium]
MQQDELKPVPDSEFFAGRKRAPWLVYTIASLGLVINIVYFGSEAVSKGESGFEAHLTGSLLEHVVILSQVFIFPVIAYLAHRIIVDRQLDEYSRRLELEVAARTRELEDLKSFSENIMASVNDLIFVIGSDGRFQFVSGNCEKVLGYAPEQLIGSQYIDLAAPGAVAMALGNFERIMRGEEVPAYEIEMVDAAGERKFVEVVSAPYWECGRVLAQVGVARDVSERKRLEQQVFDRNREFAALNAVSSAVGQWLDLDQVLRAALEQVATLFTAHRACMHVVDPDTGELCLRVWKGGSDEFIRGINRIKPGEGLVGMAAERGEAIARNLDQDYPADTVELVAGEGLMSIAAIPMKSKGRLIGVMGLGSERPDRFSRTDLDLLGSVASQVAMAVENALLFEDLKGKTQQLTSQNEELAWTTNQISKLIKVAEREKSFAVRYENPHLAACWEVKQCSQSDCPSYKSSNLRCWQVAGTHCGGEAQGVFAQKLGNCERCEVYRLARADRLNSIGEDFNNMMAMLEQKVEEQHQLQEQLVHSTKLAAIGELAANIAHEINNPLTGVLGYAALLKQAAPADDPNTKNLMVIENETLRARDIVRNLLDFARQDSLKRRKMSINDVVGNTLSLLRKQAELSNVAVSVEVDEALPHVRVDANQIKQVFINIINNALHAMPGGGRLDIAVRAAKPDGRRPWVEVVFADTGDGIAPEKLGRVFDPFFTTKDAGKGTGLGLSVSQRIIEEHGGVIEVASLPGSGSTFTVKLPTANVSTGFKSVA